MSVTTLQEQLRSLRLSTAARELPSLLSENKKSAQTDWVVSLLERELDARRERALERRITFARFPELATLEAFDWDFNPDIPRERVMNLATEDFFKAKRIALFLGKPGNGKTHLALGVGLAAVRQGHKVYCTSVKRLAKDVALAKASHSLDTLFKKILSCRLWILDDWGVVSLGREASEEIFDLLDRRKHVASMILTSNRAVEEWPEVFPDPVLAAAAIDRMFDRAEVLMFTGESYRLKGRIDSKIVDGDGARVE
jgi:DNA replication protein DnaC